MSQLQDVQDPQNGEGAVDSPLHTTHSRDSSNQEDSGSVYGGSTTALILDPSSDDEDDEMFLTFEDEEEDHLSDDSRSQVSRAAYFTDSLPPASPPAYTTQLLLLTPALLLGSTLLDQALQTGGSGFSSRPLGVLWLGLGALLAALSNHIWIMLGRYVRKWRSASTIFSLYNDPLISEIT